MKEPKVHVGILFEPQIEFILLNPYRINDMEISGKQVVTYNEGRILWNGRLYDELLFEPVNETTEDYCGEQEADRHQRHSRRRLPDQRNLQ